MLSIAVVARNATKRAVTNPSSGVAVIVFELVSSLSRSIYVTACDADCLLADPASS